MVLVPASMQLLGERNWWLPRWLDRLLPNMTLEATTPALSSTDTDDRTTEPVAA
jgi:RND superfamily putative drug exporter